MWIVLLLSSWYVLDGLKYFVVVVGLSGSSAGSVESGVLSEGPVADGLKTGVWETVGSTLSVVEGTIFGGRGVNVSTIELVVCGVALGKRDGLISAVVVGWISMVREGVMFDSVSEEATMFL